MLRKVWRFVFFLNILVCNFLFLMYTSISITEIISFGISYPNLINECFVFNLFKNFSRSILSSVHIKNISSISLRYISENVLINGYMNFLSKGSIKMCVYVCVCVCVCVCVYIYIYMYIYIIIIIIILELSLVPKTRCSMPARK